MRQWGLNQKLTEEKGNASNPLNPGKEGFLFLCFFLIFIYYLLNVFLTPL